MRIIKHCLIIIVGLTLLSTPGYAANQPTLDEIVLHRLDTINQEWEELHKSFNEFFDSRWDVVDEAEKLNKWDLDIELSEHEGTLVARVKMPNVNPDNVQLDIEHNVLKISVYKAEQSDTSHSSQGYQMLRSLPYEIDVAASQATHKDGLLTIAMPRAQKKTSTIAITKEETPIKSIDLDECDTDYVTENKELSL